jgi:putative ABC transport system permease protein
VLIAALAIAVAMMSSVGIMVSSFRETVAAWLDQRLEADVYLSPAGFASADQHPRMDASLADRIERLPGVAAVDRSRVYSISFEGLPATLAAGELVKLGRYSRIRLLAGENSSAVAELGYAGNVLVSEPFANKHHLHPGDRIRLPLGGQQPQFRIAGVFYDYSSERGLIAMNRPTLLKYLPDPAVSSVAVYLKPGANSQAVRRAIDQVISGRGIVVVPHAAIRRAGMATFDRTFRITWALEAVAIAVAIMGIASALLAMVLDRRRQFGLLRFLGCSLPQVRRLILAEAAFLGLVANAVGLVLGVALSLVLIYVVNKQSFGWTIQFHWPVALLFSALTAVYAATIAAALYPARTAMRLNPIDVVHEE